jgi:alpha-D-ribose 1-methylphosphonate 5-triphosphate diphosphatase
VIADGTGIGHVRATLRAGAKIFSDGSIFLARAA